MGIPFKQYLYGALCFATVLIVMLNVLIFQTPDTAMQEFFALTLYFSFVAWAGGQLLSIRLREQRQARNPVGSGPVPSLTEDIRLEEAALSLAETHLKLGETIDTICSMVEPRFADWNPSQRASFRERLMTALQERRSNPQEGEPA
jgi:hypothetical protein